MVDISKARKSIEKIYFDTCNIYEYLPYKDPVTKQTKHKRDIVHENIPCKLSFKTITSTTIDDGVGKIGQAAKLSINPDIVIKAGSKIVVTRDNKVLAFKNSGQPALHRNHQEIVLELFEKWS
jgi:hypothetical protein